MATNEKIYNPALMRYRLGNLLITLGVLTWLPFIVLRIAGETPSLFLFLPFHLLGVIGGSRLRAYARKEHLLFEGAQGAMLDLDHGSYPFVTSSHPISGGATTGGGIAPLQIDEVMGVMKAYATRVGSGPFVTELTDAIGERIAVTGHEVGTTTGRRRRVGWNDAVPLRYAVELNGVSSIMLNKLDVLSGIPEILLCVAYEIDGKRVERWPTSSAEIARAKAIYETFPGWEQEITNVRAMADLPENARRYVTALEEIAGAPIVLLSVGPERTQTIERAWRPLRHAKR